MCFEVYLRSDKRARWRYARHEQEEGEAGEGRRGKSLIRSLTLQFSWSKSLTVY